MGETIKNPESNTEAVVDDIHARKKESPRCMMLGNSLLWLYAVIIFSNQLASHNPNHPNGLTDQSFDKLASFARLQRNLEYISRFAAEDD